ncbi:MAG TPA: hypothetical protein VGC46_08330 [Allosphingosinicella sp.]
MRKVLITLAIASATVVASPSVAQRYGYGHQGGQIQREINQLENRIDRSFRNGRISRREAASLQREANGLQRDYFRFARNGLDRGEYRNLQVRLDRLQNRLRDERRDRDGRRY